MGIPLKGFNVNNFFLLNFHYFLIIFYIFSFIIRLKVKSINGCKNKYENEQNNIPYFLNFHFLQKK